MIERDTKGKLGDLRALDGHIHAALTVPNERETIGDFEIPTWVELETVGSIEPDLFVRVELRDGAPQIVEVRWTSKPHQSEVKQKHLRSVDLETLVTAMMAEATAGMASTFAEAQVGTEKSEALVRDATKLIERQRLPKEYRVITDSFLRAVAVVYRQNIDHAPTQAVARFFGVKSRMASTYVDRARRAGHLPPTKQGQKKA